MSRSKKYQPTRDYYILKFGDENFEKEWKTGNFCRFMRNLWNCNEILRLAWKGKVKNANQFAYRMQGSISRGLDYHKKRYNVNTAPFIGLFPRDNVNWKTCYMTITRIHPKEIKGLQ
jgi:hypothetical protein